MSVPSERLVQIGWWCWHCRGINERACRSDNPPIYTTEEWAEEMVDQVVNDE